MSSDNQRGIKYAESGMLDLNIEINRDQGQQLIEIEENEPNSYHNNEDKDITPDFFSDV